MARKVKQITVPYADEAAEYCGACPHQKIAHGWRRNPERIPAGRCHSTDCSCSQFEPRGSLTATEPPANAAGGPLLEPHDGGCRCWPHVSQSDAVKAVEHAALMEYRSGSPRGVTPALAEWRLSEAFRMLGVRAPREFAIQVLAEYARLGSPEEE